MHSPFSPSPRTYNPTVYSPISLLMQDFGRQLLYRYCDGFVNALIAGRIRRIRYGRHCRDGPCLCQYVEQVFFNLKNEDLA